MLGLILALTLSFHSGQFLDTTPTAHTESIPSHSLRDKYHEFNVKYFKEKLPEGDALHISYSVLPLIQDDSGQTYVTNFDGDEEIWIYINAKLRDFWYVSDAVLLHEMIHVKLRNTTKNDPHGVAFFKELHRLMTAGAFDDLL